MKSGTTPFKFDIGDLLSRARRQLNNRLGNVTLSLPFLSIAVNPNNREQQIAREIVIRLKDRRVLSARECCDNCIDRALTSLQEIRQTLVNKQVELLDDEAVRWGLHSGDGGERRLFGAATVSKPFPLQQKI